MKKMLRYPWVIVAVILSITVFFAAQLPKAVLDNDVVNFIPQDSPEVKAYESQQDLYGSQVIMLMALKQKTGTVFEKDFLLKLKELTQKLEDLPLAESVTSLANTDAIRGEGDAIVVSPLMPDDFSGTPAELAALKEGILGWDLYHKSLVSEDFKSTQILISVEGNIAHSDDQPGVQKVDNKSVIYQDIQKILKGMDLSGQEVYLAGTPVLAVLMSQNMVKDLVVLIPLVALVIILTLFLSFRRLGGVLLPLVTVIISTLWTVGLMALLGVKLTMIATVIPVILMAVGSAYGIHVISHYYDAMLAQKRTLNREEFLEVLVHVLQKIALPVLLAGLTTMAGFGSLGITSIIPVRDFGIFATFGVLTALIVALTFIPALLVLRGPHPYKEPKTPGQTEIDGLSKALLRFFNPFIRKPRLTLGLSVLVIGLSVWGTSQIVVDNAVVEFFKGDTEISQADRFLRSDFNGTKNFNINVKGLKKGDLNDPEVLAAMDDLARHLESTFPEVGKVISYSQFIKRINQVINADEPADKIRGSVSVPEQTSSAEPEFGFGFGESSELSFGFEEAAAPSLPAPAPIAPVADPQITRGELLTLLNQAVLLSDRQNFSSEELLTLINRATNYQGTAYYEIPTDPGRYNQADKEGLKNLVGNYLVLVGSGTEEWADDPLEPSQARMAVQINSTGNLITQEIVAEAKKYAQQRFPEGVTLEMAGMALIEKGTTDLIVQSQVWNIISSVALVILILSLFFRSAVAGLLSIIPLGLSILVSFAVMGFAGIKLDAATSMVAAIAIGTGIDYTIHFLVAYHRERKNHDGHHNLMQYTILTTGKAIMFNALSVAFGFLVLVFSQFNPLVYLGLLIALTMLTSSIAALTIMPILMELLKPKFLDTPLITDTLGGEK